MQLHKKPKYTGIMLIRDEEDIIKECIEHHFEQGINHLIITDNASTDKTNEIIQSFKEVTIINEPETNYQQQKWCTTMSERAFEMGTEWIICIDADEFWYNIKSLGQEDDMDVIYVNQMFNHFPMPDTPYEGFSIQHMPYYIQVPCYRRIAYRAKPGIKNLNGNHHITIWDKKPKKIKLSEDIKVHHYPIRSYEQFEQKISRCGPSIKNVKGKKVGIHWRKQHKMLLNNKLRDFYEKKILRK